MNNLKKIHIEIENQTIRQYKDLNISNEIIKYSKFHNNNLNSIIKKIELIIKLNIKDEKNILLLRIIKKKEVDIIEAKKYLYENKNISNIKLFLLLLLELNKFDIIKKIQPKLENNNELKNFFIIADILNT